MLQENTALDVVFARSGESHQVPLEALVFAATDFLTHFCERSLVGDRFYEIVHGGADDDGSTRLSRLLTASGHADDRRGFFSALLDGLAKADGTGGIVIGGVLLPHLLLMAVLEVVLPGNRFISVKSTEQLERLANITVPADRHGDMQAVIDTYPVRLSMHTIRQMRVSRDVAYQYLPFVQELDTVGYTNTWIGQFHQGLLEQMYRNRVIFLLNMSCPVYCRFCFRKHKESRNEANPTPADVRRAVAHVADSPDIKEIVMTGGDPFLSRTNMAAAIDGLMDIGHVQTLRLATRSIAYYPHLFLADDGELLGYLKRKSIELNQRGKRMEVATHFIHPDEISPQSLAIITELVKNGIAVYVQTPFLHDCNDEGPELVRLFSLLRGAGAELHYIYIPCSPIHGNSVYWAPIDKGLAVGRYLRAHLSDRMIPRICTATPIGKMDWHTSGWAVEPVAGNENFMWIRSPYTPAYFKRFAPLANELDNIRVNDEGTIDIQYMARIDDPSLFLGARPPRPADYAAPPRKNLAAVMPLIDGEDAISPSIVATGSTTLSRVHFTRVELSTAASASDFSAIAADRHITDVVVVSPTDVLDEIGRVRRIVRHLQEIPHVNAVRLRSRAFSGQPHRYTTALVDALGGLNHLTMVNPLRLEIETLFITADQVAPDHAHAARRLADRGITVYANTPLLGRINDAADAIHDLAFACRSAGIEFHHLYVAGLPVQDDWNRRLPVDLYDVVDIATKVRRDGSGREIPRYIIKTVLGETDFGLSATIMARGADLTVRLLPYDIDYFRAMAPDFEWPAEVATDEHGHPAVPVRGLVKTTAFPLC